MLKWRYIRRARVKVLAMISIISVVMTLKNFFTSSHLMDSTSNKPSAALEEYSEYDTVENILVSEKPDKSNDLKLQHVSTDEPHITTRSKSALTMSPKKSLNDVSKCGYNVS